MCFFPQLGVRDVIVPGESPLAEIGNASRTMRKNGEVLKRGGFD